MLGKWEHFTGEESKASKATSGRHCVFVAHGGHKASESKQIVLKLCFVVATQKQNGSLTFPYDHFPKASRNERQGLSSPQSFPYLFRSSTAFPDNSRFSRTNHGLMQTTDGQCIHIHRTSNIGPRRCCSGPLTASGPRTVAKNAQRGLQVAAAESFCFIKLSHSHKM